METSVNERIKLWLKRIGETQHSFCGKIGVSTGYLSSMRNSPSHKIVRSIAMHYPSVNTQWLLYGEGEMLLTSTDVAPSASVEKKNHIPILPIAAQAGSLAEYAESVTADQCEMIAAPIKGADFAIRVDGDSMTPDYPSGSLLFVSRIDDSAFIEWGKCYVLDTTNGPVVKRVMPSDTDDSIMCVSVNPAYPPFRVSRVHIYSMFRVRACVRLE